MRKRSLKRASEERLYTKNRKDHLEENPYCQAEVMCHGLLAVEIHHKKGRIGELLNNREFFLSVCRMCHNWIESNPNEAKEKGLSLSRLSKQN